MADSQALFTQLLTHININNISKKRREHNIKKGGTSHRCEKRQELTIGFSNVTPVFTQILEKLKSRLTIIISTYVNYYYVNIYVEVLE